jgi:hypothetical protein
MTNNPTIDGVSRELLERVAYRLSDLKQCELSETLFAILSNPFKCNFCDDKKSVCVDWEAGEWMSCPKCSPESNAPAVERLEPEAFMYQHEETGVIGFVDVQQIEWGFEKNNPRLQIICPLYRDPPEVAALQSTIAKLQARVAELESARGEPVAEVIATGGPHDGEDRVLCELQAELPPIGTKLYAAPPAPVAVVEKYDEVLLPFLSLMRTELHANSHKGDRQGWLQMDRKTAVLEVFYHLGKLHQAVHRDETAAIKEYAADVANMCMMLLDVCACLDDTVALNKDN